MSPTAFFSGTSPPVAGLEKHVPSIWHRAVTTHTHTLGRVYDLKHGAFPAPQREHCEAR